MPANVHTPSTQIPVYLLATLRITDLEAYVSDYGLPLLPMLEAAGGEILVGTPEVDVLEGDYRANWAVVVKFPSQAAAQGWYASQEYQALIPVRRRLTDTAVSTLILAPQFQGPPQ